jgi:integrase
VVQKHKTGESALSSRAITSTIIKDSYHFNNQWHDHHDYEHALATSKSPDSWGGRRARLLVHSVVTLSFCCLLRIDEALNLQVSDITIESTECISITLPFRKTNPYGGMLGMMNVIPY